MNSLLPVLTEEQARAGGGGRHSPRPPPRPQQTHPTRRRAEREPGKLRPSWVGGGGGVSGGSRGARGTADMIAPDVSPEAHHASCGSRSPGGGTLAPGPQLHHRPPRGVAQGPSSAPKARRPQAAAERGSEATRCTGPGPRQAGPPFCPPVGSTATQDGALRMAPTNHEGWFRGKLGIPAPPGC